MNIQPYSVSNFVEDTISNRWFSPLNERGLSKSDTADSIAKHLASRVAAVAIPIIALLVDLPGNLILGSLKWLAYRFSDESDRVRTLKEEIAVEHFEASGRAVKGFVKSLLSLIPTLVSPGWTFENAEERRAEPTISTPRAKELIRMLEKSVKPKPVDPSQLQPKQQQLSTEENQERDCSEFVRRERQKKINEFFVKFTETLSTIDDNVLELEEKNETNMKTTFRRTHVPERLIKDHIEGLDKHLEDVEKLIPSVYDLDAPLTEEEIALYQDELERQKKLSLENGVEVSSSGNVDEAPADRVLKLMDKRLSPEFSMIFHDVFKAYATKYGESVVKSFHAGEEYQTFEIEFSRPVQFWADTKDDNGKDDPAGGAVMLLGDEENKMKGWGREMENGEKQLFFTSGFSSYSKNTEPVGKSKGYPEGRVLSKIESIVYTPKGNVVTNLLGLNIRIGAEWLFVPEVICKKQQTRHISTVQSNWAKGEVVEGPFKDFIENKLSS